MVRPVSRKINKLVNLEGTFFFAKLIKSKPFRSIDPFTDRYIYIHWNFSNTDMDFWISLLKKGRNLLH